MFLTNMIQGLSENKAKKTKSIQHLRLAFVGRHLESPSPRHLERLEVGQAGTQDQWQQAHTHTPSGLQACEWDYVQSFQLEMSNLNDTAPENIPVMSATRDTSHLEMSWLNDIASRNI